MTTGVGTSNVAIEKNRIVIKIGITEIKDEIEIIEIEVKTKNIEIEVKVVITEIEVKVVITEIKTVAETRKETGDTAPAPADTAGITVIDGRRRTGIRMGDEHQKIAGEH
jgi:hypothetical protein